MMNGTIAYLIFTLSVVAATTTLAEEEEFIRDIRQAPVFFQNGLSPSPPQQRGILLSKTQQQPFAGTAIPKFATFGGAPPQGFRATSPPSVDEDEIQETEKYSLNPPRPLPSQQLLHFRQSPQPPQQFHSTSSLPTALQQPITATQVSHPRQMLLLRTHAPQESQQFRRPVQQLINKNQHLENPLSEEELEEKEEPDRLTELLPQSKFTCNGKKTGYYADDGLNCEVFHYCQDNARHSWLCPEGFSFHQVHLICMPPSSDNICQESSQFHFVNDFLYRPINADEAQSRPNVTLRYADRYYPENYYETAQEENGDRTFHRKQPLVQSTSPRANQSPHQFSATLRPLAQLPQHFGRQPFNGNQVFHISEEINTSPQSRRSSPISSQRILPQPQNEFNSDNK